MKALIACCLLLAGCAPTPDSYEIPPQHAPVFQPPAVGDFVRAEDPKADSYFLSGIKSLEGPDWRWTSAEPELRFQVSEPGPKVFRFEFTVHERTLPDTGPLEIEFYLNGHLLGRERYAEPKRYHFEKPCPPEWLQLGENRVLVKVLNPWKASDPGVFLGFLFHAAGLVTP